METTQTPVSRMRNRVDILINDFKIKFGLSKIRKGQAAAVGQVEVTFWIFISTSLGSAEVLLNRGASGRGFDSVTQGAKSLNVWASVKPETREAHHHQPGASCATCQPGGPCQSGPCGRDLVFLPNSLSICSLLSEVKGGWVSTDKRRAHFLPFGHALLRYYKNFTLPLRHNSDCFPVKQETSTTVNWHS